MGVGNKMDALTQNANNFEGMEVGTANIKVFGAGGAGGNAINWLYKKGLQGA